MAWQWLLQQSLNTEPSQDEEKAESAIHEHKSGDETPRAALIPLRHVVTLLLVVSVVTLLLGLLVGIHIAPGLP